MNRTTHAAMRVQWHMGQALLPAHFFAQEESLRAEASLRLSLLSPPTWGIGDLRWDDSQLGNARLSIREISLVFESGTVISCPGNASVSPLDLSTIGAMRTPIYAHLESDFEVMAPQAGAADEEGIERIRQKIELSTRDPGDESLQIAEIRCSADGELSLCRDYVPPLLCVRRHLFAGPLGRIAAVTDGLEHQFKADLQANHLSGDTQVLAKQALRSVLTMRAMLVDLDGPPPMPLHPYEVYRALRLLYIDTCLLRDAEYDALGAAYDHRAIGPSFDKLLSPLEVMAGRGAADIPYVEFTLASGLLSCPIGKDVKRAAKTFLLIQKPNVNSRIDTTRVKLASPSRLRTVHERALRGIEYRQIPRPPFAQSLALTVDMYELQPGQEWDAAVEAGEIVLFDAPQLEGCRLYLYSLS